MQINSVFPEFSGTFDQHRSQPGDGLCQANKVANFYWPGAEESRMDWFSSSSGRWEAGRFLCQHILQFMGAIKVGRQIFLLKIMPYNLENEYCLKYVVSYS